jgi:hypothetical protein
LLSNINLIVTSYRDTLKKGVLYKTSYKDTKSLLENTKLYNAKLEEDIKYYTAIVDRLIAAPATPTLSVPTPSIPTPPDPSPKSPILSYSHSRLGSPILQASNRGARVAKLPDPTLFTGDHIVFDDWLIQIKNKLQGNTALYPIEDLKIIYISSRLIGNTLALTNSRMDEDSPYRYY